MKNPISPGQLLSKSTRRGVPLILTQIMSLWGMNKIVEILASPASIPGKCLTVGNPGSLRKNSTAAKCSCHACRLKENEIVAQETSALRVQAKHISL
ncbi:hypothetical protein EI555_021115 [Monodon monoceros]|uniref:Uncharacterized protein n=1 Tax=Monodon monoceros TaxID=40151 RepID=A0A4U1F2W7_MONMO|nr:hypothetical protein EI555_021115 [Monodon monoceros]